MYANGIMISLKCYILNYVSLNELWSLLQRLRKAKEPSQSYNWHTWFVPLLSSSVEEFQVCMDGCDGDLQVAM